MLSRIEYQSETNQKQLLKDLREIAEPIMFDSERPVTNMQLFNAVRFITINKAAIKKLVDNRKVFITLFNQIFKDDREHDDASYRKAVFNLCEFLELLYANELYYRLEYDFIFNRTTEGSLVSMLNPFLLATDDSYLMELLETKSRYSSKNKFYSSDDATIALQKNLNSKNNIFRVLIQIENSIETNDWTLFQTTWDKLLNIFTTYENYLKNPQAWQEKFRNKDFAIPNYTRNFGHAMFTNDEYKELYQTTLVYFFQMIQKRISDATKPFSVEEQAAYLRILEAGFSEFNGQYKRDAFNILKKMVVDLGINNMQASLLLAKMYLKGGLVQGGAQTAKEILEQCLFPSNENNTSHVKDDVAAPPEMVQFYVENFNELSKSTMNPDSDEKITVPARVLIHQLGLAKKSKNSDHINKLLKIIEQFAIHESIPPATKLDLVAACLDIDDDEKTVVTCLEVVERILKVKGFQEIEKPLSEIKTINENSDDGQKLALYVLLRDELNNKYARLKKFFHIKYGVALARRKKFKDAKGELEQALRIPLELEDPSNKHLSYLIGQVCHSLREYDAAINYGYHKAYLSKAKFEEENKRYDEYYQALDNLYEVCLVENNASLMKDLIEALIRRNQRDEKGFQTLLYKLNSDAFIQFLRSDVSPETVTLKYDILQGFFKNKLISPTQLPLFLENISTLKLSQEQLLNLLELAFNQYSAKDFYDQQLEEQLKTNILLQLGGIITHILTTCLDALTLDEEGVRKYTKLKELEKTIENRFGFKIESSPKRKLMEEVSVAHQESEKKSSGTITGFFKKTPLEELATKNFHANLLILQRKPDDKKIDKEMLKNIAKLANIDMLNIYENNGLLFSLLIRPQLRQWAAEAAKEPKTKAPTMLTAVIAIIYQPKAKTLFEGLDFIKTKQDEFLEVLNNYLKLEVKADPTIKWQNWLKGIMETIITAYPEITEKLSSMLHESFAYPSRLETAEESNPANLSEQLYPSNLEQIAEAKTTPTEDYVPYAPQPSESPEYQAPTPDTKPDIQLSELKSLLVEQSNKIDSQANQLKTISEAVSSLQQENSSLHEENKALREEIRTTNHLLQSIMKMLTTPGVTQPTTTQAAIPADEENRRGSSPNGIFGKS